LDTSPTYQNVKITLMTLPYRRNYHQSLKPSVSLKLFQSIKYEKKLKIGIIQTRAAETLRYIFSTSSSGLFFSFYGGIFNFYCYFF